MEVYQPTIQVFTCGPDLVPTGHVRLSYVELALVDPKFTDVNFSKDAGDTRIT